MRTVVVTRPQKQAFVWLKAFEDKGFKVVHLPLLGIEPLLPNPDLLKAWERMNEWSWVMFVSANAVEYFFNAQQQSIWPAHLRAGAVGKGTAGALLAAGVPAGLIDQPDDDEPKDSEHLWGHICSNRWQNGHVLVVRGVTDSGRPDRNWLIDQLEQAGARTEALAVYRRRAPLWTEEQKIWLNSEEAQLACWLLTSSEGVDYLPKGDWSKAIAFVTHPRIGETAKRSGFVQVIYTEPELHIVLNSVQYVTGSHENPA